MEIVLLLLAIVVISVGAIKTPNACQPIRTKFGINCECNESHCDTLIIPVPNNGDEFTLVTTSEDGERFSYEYGHFANESKLNLDDGTNILLIDQAIKYNRSEIIGFGGAWTGSVREILSQFSPKLREHFYNSYFSVDEGMGYNLLRIPIGGVDFDIEPWTYDMQSEPDPNLLHFPGLNEKDKLQNVQIKEMRRLTKNNDIKVLGAAWSPPRWMKAKHEWYGSLDNQLIPDYYQAFADYHARWLNLTTNDGVPVWTISTGNQPAYAVHFQCGQIGNTWNSGDQADWMVNHLAPALQQTGLDVKIHVYDDMRNGSIEYLGNMTQRQPNVMEYADFIALHPYFDMITSPEELGILRQKYNKPILYTEMSFGVKGTGVVEGTMPGSWPRAEEFLTIIMDALRHDVAGYIDWNLILDSKGGPSYIGRSIDAFILANEDHTGFHKQPMYYAMAHFAKFIPRHSLRIASTFSGSSKSQVQAVAYQRPDDKISLVLYNNGTNLVDVTLVDALRGNTEITLKPKSLNTIIYSNNPYN